MPTPIYITKNGTDISNIISWNTVDMVSQLTKEVASLGFSVSFDASKTIPTGLPVVGDIIEMFDTNGGGGIIFGGTCTETEATIEGLFITYAITCTDWSYLFDGTLVKKNYAMLDPSVIVNDIVSNFCGGKGFTTNHVQFGNFLVPSIKFNYQQPTKCLESLAKLIGWDWYIDANKDVHFGLFDVEDAIGSGGMAPITVDATSGQIEWNSLDVDLNLQNMQNSVYVIGGNYTKTFTATNTPDTFLTDGVLQFFTTSYPYDISTIVVTVNGVTQTIGTANSTDPATVQVLYNDAQRWIQFTAGAPTAGNTIKVYGQAKVPIVAHASDNAAIATYGEYQSVVVDSKITSVPEAQARATAAILQFGHPVFDVKVSTYVPGCQIGQAISVNLPAFGCVKQLVIKRIEATVFVPGANALCEYQLECIGSDNVTFVDIMTTLLQQEAAQTDVGDSTVNENLEVISEPVTIAEVLSATATQAPYVWGAAASNVVRWGFWKWS